MKHIIRSLEESEYYILKDFTYEAIFKRDPNMNISRDIIDIPELKVFYEDFGKDTDECLVAEVDGKIVGAVWTRIIDGDIKGYGHVDSETPEFAISLIKEWRGKGIGTDLMKEMLSLLKNKGYKKTSLAVQKDNYAVGMYKNVGFEIVKELEEEYLMICELR